MNLGNSPVSFFFWSCILTPLIKLYFTAILDIEGLFLYYCYSCYLFNTLLKRNNFHTENRTHWLPEGQRKDSIKKTQDNLVQNIDSANIFK